ncbi:MAG TPA: branched-chain amino acid ABC transporter permease, partial [Candidatus Limnocylindria bacterium]|nr:branched-chain amino acid ABC transporter permease [Candidatus Limnocylindria bacterium]
DGLALAVLAVLVVLPFGTGAYPVRVATVIFMWAALAGSWNLMAGYAGAVDLGPVFYYGIGAFVTAAFMLKAGLPFVVSAALAGLVAVGIAFAIGTPTLRLRGAYFAIGTLALAESGKQLALAWDRLLPFPLTGGSAGISLPLTAGYLGFYYMMLALMTAVTGAALWLRHSKFGYGLRAVGENDRLAEASGVNIHQLKRRLYAGSAFIIAMTGGTAGYWLSYINAAEVFSASVTFQMVVMTLLGGLGTPFGPVLGAAFLTLVSEFLGTRFVYHYLIAIGVIIVAVSLFAPAGLAGLGGLVRRRKAPAAG